MLLYLILCIGATAVTSSSVLGELMPEVRLDTWLEDEVDTKGVCSEAGFACENCTHAVTCVPFPGGFLKVSRQECHPDQTCNAIQGECSSEHVPECQASTVNYKHNCVQFGIFPDAYDCRKFHICSTPEGGKPAQQTAFCPRHYGFDPQTAQCSIKLTKGHCSSKLVPECTSVGQHGVLPLSLNHYYICLINKGHYLHPQVFLCPNGWYFWKSLCRPEKEEKKVDDGLRNTTEVTTTIEQETSNITRNRKLEMETTTTERVWRGYNRNY